MAKARARTSLSFMAVPLVYTEQELLGLADNSMSGPLFADIKRAHPFEPIRKLKHLGIGQRLPCIVVAGLPVLLHGAPRELKILSDAFIRPGAINQMHDVADLVVGFGERDLGVGARAQFLRHSFE